MTVTWSFGSTYRSPKIFASIGARSRACASICLFFFQAEDGIRDIGVTGVQTCALPISDYPDLMHPFASAIDTDLPKPPEHTHILLDFAASWVEIPQAPADRYFSRYPEESKIGRASCRERV